MMLLSAVYWIEPFELCDTQLRALAGKLGLLTKDALGEILRTRLNEIWKIRAVGKLEAFVAIKGEWFAETAMVGVARGSSAIE